MDKNESDLAVFITERLEKAGGSAQVKYLSQFLPSLSFEIRNCVASNQTELMKFLRKYANLFQVDANACVRLHNSESSSTHEGKIKDNRRDTSSERNANLPAKLLDAEGVVIKIHPTFGFIAAKSPFKTTVYFTPVCFGDKNKTLFTDFEDLNVGTKICFHATKGKDDHYSKYRAYRVWYPKKEKEENKKTVSNGFEPNPRKTRETGLYDPVINEGEGRILKLFPNYGFIAADNDTNNTVFFYKNQICNFENVVDLTKALKLGDLVEFKAVRAPKKNIKARWSATQVWIKKSDKIKATSKQTQDKPAKHCDNIEENYLKDLSGKIFPHAKGTIIKFGKNYGELADADSSLFFMLGSKVHDVSWEFSDGDNVHFDAVRIKSHPGWKATLVWTGERPNVVLPPDLGDFSEYLDEVESVPDSASCISKSSDNSVTSEISNKSFKKPQSRSSGYSSSKVSQEDKNHFKKSSFKSFDIKKHSHNDSERDDLSDSASCYSRSSNLSASETGSKIYRRSRSQHAKETHFKKRNSNQGKTSKSSSIGSHLKSEKERFQRHLEFVHSSMKDLPRNVVEDSCSTRSNSSKEKLTFLSSSSQDNKTYTNWGDSPYPDEEENDSHSFTEEKGCLEGDSLSERDFSLPRSRSSVTDLNLTDCDKEIYSSEDEFSDTVQDMDKSAASGNQNEPHELLKDCDLAIENENEQQPSKKASITRFHEIEGTVTQVFCKYAKIVNSKLLEPASFFWSDLYQNGVPVSEDGVDDLREVIKEGDVLKFNCMQIINDEGFCFIKVTMAWRDWKPNIVELTPEQFIAQIKLSVTVNEDSVYDYSEKDLAVDSQNSEENTAEDLDPPIRKFLTTLSDHEDDAVEEMRNSVDAVEDAPDNLVISTSSCANQLMKRNSTEVSSYHDKAQLVEGISKIIKLNGLSNKSQGNLDELSSEVLDFVLNSCAMQKYRSAVHQSDKESQTEINQIASTYSGHVQIENRIEFTNTESQTIFTGEVIGKSTFTVTMNLTI